MKKAIYFLIGVILGGILGWCLSFLRLPFMEEEHSFQVGFIACLSLTLALFVLLSFWNKKLFKIKSSQSRRSSTLSRIYLLVSIIVIITTSVLSYQFFEQNQQFKEDSNKQTERIKEQAELIESLQKNSASFFMNNLLNQLDYELKNNPQRTLSDTTIDRIATFSFSLTPYLQQTEDSLASELSHERGQLLLTLISMSIDSSSFSRILQKVSFAQANLEGANLASQNLNGIDLQRANLKNANLKKASLKGAKLSQANLWGTNLKKSNLSDAKLERCDLSWAQLNKSNLYKADLNGALLRNTKLRKAQLKETSFKWAKLNGALLDSSVMYGTDFLRADLRKANLQYAKLEKARIRAADLSDANLDNIQFTKVVVEEDWLKKLEDWHLSNANELLNAYKVVRDSSKRFEKEKFYLIKK